MRQVHTPNLLNESEYKINIVVKLITIIFAFAMLAGCVTSTPKQASTASNTNSAKYKYTPVSKKAERSSIIKHVNHEAKNCLALVIYWEARGEGDQGMIAVGSVVLNRVKSPHFPNSVCAVAFEGGETPPCQFSWWCDGKSDRPRNHKQWETALNLADKLLSNKMHDPTGGALFFHNTSVRSSFHSKRQRTARIGNHIFYR